MSWSHLTRMALRIGSVGIGCGFLIGAGSCGPTTVVAPVTITVNAINSGPALTLPVDVTRIDSNGACEYRLEFMSPNDKARGISEIGGNRGSAQRINSCTAFPPAFAATLTSNAAWFDEQSTYYWAKKSRDYAKAALWVTPPGWDRGGFTMAEAEVSLSVLTVGDEDSGFRLACAPRGQQADGCMRYYPGQNPKIYIPAGRALPGVVSHEFGHYAAGFVYGHMDTLGSGGFKIDNCVHRAFQEGIAEIFKQLFLHHELTSSGVMTPSSSSIPSLTTYWIDDCGPGEYTMSDPLWIAFAQSLWGMGPDTRGAAVTVPWPNPAAANTGMVNAFTYALLTTRDFRIHDFAGVALAYIERIQPANIAAPVRAIFEGRGLTPRPNGRQCIENRECGSSYCDNGDGTSGTRLCMPARGTGQNADPCSHDNQCASNRCAGLSRDAANNWTPGACAAAGALGAACTTNSQCASTYCDAGSNTANTNQCMPRGGTGLGGEPCSNDRQCRSNACAGLRTNDAGQWVPGLCVAQGALGATCNTNSQCASTYCDAGFNTANTNRCMPRGREGGAGDMCTHNSQCASATCNNLQQVNGAWVPGNCL